MEAVWQRRSPINLLGNHINIQTGHWTAQESTIGGNCDSFYEYLLKNGVLFGDERSFSLFDEAYSAIILHVYKDPWYVTVNMANGHPTLESFESLQAFWPGVQVLYGDVEGAAHSMHAFMEVWKEVGDRKSVV